MARYRVIPDGQRQKIQPWRRQRIWDRASGVCGICQKPVPFDDLEIDHIVPLSCGGSNADSNLRPTHAFCNKSRGARLDPDDARRAMTYKERAAIYQADGILIQHLVNEQAAREAQMLDILDEVARLQKQNAQLQRENLDLQTIVQTLQRRHPSTEVAAADTSEALPWWRRLLARVATRQGGG